jgi:hypothetical protein
MQPDEFDRLLSDEKIIAPSAGFAESVMSEITRETEAPPRIGFPWKPVLSGLGVAALGAAAAASAGLTTSASVAAAQWAPIAQGIGRYANDAAAAAASATGASLALAVVLLLVPMAAYELVLRVHSRARPRSGHI